MDRPLTPLEAAAALDTIERGRLRVIDEIDLPSWYWWGVALGWVGVGLVTDLAGPGIAAAATLVFGAVHAAGASRVATGRHRSQRLSVRADVAERRTRQLVIGGLVLLTGLTVAGALAASADGARHPATVSSVVVAVVVLLGGPQLLAGIRRRAARGVAST